MSNGAMAGSPILTVGPKLIKGARSPTRIMECPSWEEQVKNQWHCAQIIDGQSFPSPIHAISAPTSALNITSKDTFSLASGNKTNRHHFLYTKHGTGISAARATQLVVPSQLVR